jgi:hypothetical protein
MGSLACALIRVPTSRAAVGIASVMFVIMIAVTTRGRYRWYTMWLGRAHSIGYARQHLDLLGFALCVNSLALHRHREQEAPSLAA